MLQKFCQTLYSKKHCRCINKYYFSSFRFPFFNQNSFWDMDPSSYLRWKSSKASNTSCWDLSHLTIREATISFFSSTTPWTWVDVLMSFPFLFSLFTFFTILNESILYLLLEEHYPANSYPLLADTLAITTITDYNGWPNYQQSWTIIMYWLMTSSDMNRSSIFSFLKIKVKNCVLKWHCKAWHRKNVHFENLFL